MSVRNKGVSALSKVIGGVGIAVLLLATYSFVIIDPVFRNEMIDSSSMGIFYLFIGLILIVIISFIGENTSVSEQNY